jgi:cytosine/adenosine deaminase-related metal-dependent hydrolase
MRAHVEIPPTGHYILQNVSVPSTYLVGSEGSAQPSCSDSLTRVTIEVQDGRLLAIKATGWAGSRKDGVPVMDAKGSIALPTFVDLHTHVGA